MLFLDHVLMQTPYHNPRCQLFSLPLMTILALQVRSGFFQTPWTLIAREMMKNRESCKTYIAFTPCMLARWFILVPLSQKMFKLWGEQSTCGSWAGFGLRTASIVVGWEFSSLITLQQHPEAPGGTFPFLRHSRLDIKNPSKDCCLQIGNQRLVSDSPLKEGLLGGGMSNW